MPTARLGLGAATSKGKLYSIGSANTVNWTAVEEYELVADTWVSRAGLLTARRSPRVVTANRGTIYNIGGTGSSGDKV